MKEQYFQKSGRLLALLLVLLISGLAHGQEPLTLQSAVALALDNNRELKQSELEVDKTSEQTRISRSLYLPSVHLNAMSNHFFNRNPFFGFGQETTSDRINYGRFGGQDQVFAAVTAVQPLFSPLALPSIHRSKLREKEGSIQLENTRQDVVTRVKLNYLEILVLQERIKLQQESILRNKKVLQDSRSLYLQGKGLRVDTLRAYTSVQNRQPELLKLQYALETATIRFKTLIGYEAAQTVVLTDSLSLTSNSAAPAEDELYESAKQGNPNLQLSTLSKQIYEEEINVAKSSRLPALSLIGQYQLQSQTNKFQYGDAYYPASSFVGVQLSVPLFAGFATNARIKQARISKQQSELQNTLANENLKETVHSNLAYHQESTERLKTTLAVKETALVSYNIIQYRYQKGIATRLELTDAEFELSSAQSNYLEAVYDYLSSLILLDRLAGKAGL